MPELKMDRRLLPWKIRRFLPVRSQFTGPLALICVFCSVAGYSGETAEELSKEASARRARLLDILEKSPSDTFHPFVRNKAIQELVSSQQFDERYVSVMILAARRERQRTFDYGTTPALAAAGRTAVPAIMKALAAAKLPDDEIDNFQLLAALGRVGPGAKDAIPGLRTLLEREDLGATARVAVRVALANTGWESKENDDYLLACLRARTEESRAAVGAMAAASLGAWAKKDVVAALCQWLVPPKEAELNNDDMDSLVNAAVALGTLGERGQDAIAPLRASLEGKHKTAIPIILWASLARIHPPGKNKTEATRMMLKTTGRFEREKAMAIICVSELLRDAQMRAEVVGMLKHADGDVVNGAVAHILVDGRAVPAAKAPLQQIVQGQRDSLDRDTAADALGVACSPDDAGMLKELLTSEKDKYVRDALVRSISMLKLDWSKGSAATENDE